MPSRFAFEACRASLSRMVQIRNKGAFMVCLPRQRAFRVRGYPNALEGLVAFWRASLWQRAWVSGYSQGMSFHGLTAKQEAFALHVAQGKGLTEAYRQAGFSAQGNALNVNASKLAKVAKVKLRIGEITRQRDRAIVATMTVTAMTVTEMLAAVFHNATKDRQHGAAATAAMGLAKLHGLLVDKTEDVTRRATRDPDAPVEIDVEHWVTETLPRILGPLQNVDAVTGLRGSASTGKSPESLAEEASVSLAPSYTEPSNQSLDESLEDLGLGTRTEHKDASDKTPQGSSLEGSGAPIRSSELVNDIKHLVLDVGAPAGAPAGPSPAPRRPRNGGRGVNEGPPKNLQKPKKQKR